jgi:hypothetical protein
LLTAGLDGFLHFFTHAVWRGKSFQASLFFALCGTPVVTNDSAGQLPQNQLNGFRAPNNSENSAKDLALAIVLKRKKR